MCIAVFEAEVRLNILHCKEIILLITLKKPLKCVVIIINLLKSKPPLKTCMYFF